VLIIAGRVQVNGVVAIIGQKADPQKDKIVVDGKPIKSPEQKIYVALHKPRGILSVVEPEVGDKRQTVRDLVPVGERLYPVGRLDYDSEGLVLMTNDGDLAQKLTHPSFEHEKEYRVLVATHPDEDQLAIWRRGVVMEDGYKTLPADVRIEGLAGKGAWLRIVMREGRKRQIREIGSLIGLPVVRIVRIRIGSLQLGGLKTRDWRYLTAPEIAALKVESSSGPSPRPSRGGRKFTRRPPAEQSNPSGRPERADRPNNRPGRPTTRPERTGAPDQTGQPEQTDRFERPGRPERPVRTGRPRSGTPDQPGQHNQLERSRKPGEKPYKNKPR
jgi:23S rRNA pseudouridine2605 synthase